MTISEVSRITGLSQDTLRYYERIKLIPAIKRSENGIREYEQSDVKWIDFVKCMRSVDLPIETLIKYFQLVKLGDGTIEERKDLLKEQRNALIKKRDEIENTIERLNHKIANYKSTMREKEIDLID